MKFEWILAKDFLLVALSSFAVRNEGNFSIGVSRIVVESCN